MNLKFFTFLFLFSFSNTQVTHSTFFIGNESDDLDKLLTIQEHLRLLTSSDFVFCAKPTCSWCNGCSNAELEQRKEIVNNRINQLISIGLIESCRRSV